MVRRPRIKFSHRPVRYGEYHVRIGGIVPGVRGDLVDRDGWVWALLELLDGSRTVDSVTETMTKSFPRWPAGMVRAAIDDLVLAGHVEDADETASGLDEVTEERYSRSEALFGWMDRSPLRTGREAQVSLRQAGVVVIGLGGVGCTAALALVLSGVGRLHCVDRDVVEVSNLNRQVLYTEADVGRTKVAAAVSRLRSHNSAADITGAQADVDGPSSLRALATDFDVVLLAADTPREIRSWTNRACLETGSPWVYAGYHGPLITVGLHRPGEGPCADCEPAEQRARLASLPERTEWSPGIDKVVPQAANAVSAGCAGTLAAQAVISLITGVPALPANRRFGFNLMTMESVPVPAAAQPSPLCPSCGLAR
ncbi:HesA/MoeB/ThiF family protein [Streptomyces neyagawaensis]|uniref:ThiF family adenylyltransferase n=1 Tax=Streptomyces neyagawaensis TaxID=42238 RepID=A0ABV3B5L6_9ACTN